MLESKSKELFGHDESVLSVGIGADGDGYGIRVVRNASEIRPMSQSGEPIPKKIQGVPVTTVNTYSEIESLVIIPSDGNTSHGLPSNIPEAQTGRPFHCGFQISNFDDDERQRIARRLKPGFLSVGTLGCFVKTAGSQVALLTNNHVIGGTNRGKQGDKIYQRGSASSDPTMHVADLHEFALLRSSPQGSHPIDGNVIYNDIDAAIAIVNQNAAYRQGYFPLRQLPVFNGISTPKVNETVFKVGRTTGLTKGIITAVHSTVGPIRYDIGGCWFTDSFEIAGLDFSDHGDSGSVIVRETGEVLGLLYAGNGQITYACRIDSVLSHFNCTLL